MRFLPAALVAVFLCLPFASYAQDDEPLITEYFRHNAGYGQSDWLKLDSECLADAEQPWRNPIIFAPTKSEEDRSDWEQMVAFANLQCMIRLQREDNRLQRESNQLQMDLLEALTAE